MSVVPVQQFYGTEQTIFDLATDIAAVTFSGAGVNLYDNTSDASIPNAPYALATIRMPDWAAAPAAGTTVQLWGVRQDTDGTSDDTDAPSGGASNGAEKFGSWVVDDVDALQRRTIVVSMLGVKKVALYVYNGTAQNMNNDAGTNMKLTLTPLAMGINV